MKVSELIVRKPVVWQALSHRQVSVWGHTDGSACLETDSQISPAAQVEATLQVKCRKWPTHCSNEGNLT